MFDGASHACEILKNPDLKELIEEMIEKFLSPEFSMRSPVIQFKKGSIETGKVPGNYWRNRSFTDIGPKLGGYREDELEVMPSTEVQEIATVSYIDVNRPYLGNDIIQIEKCSFNIVDFGINLTGFIGAKITCGRDTRLLYVFEKFLLMVMWILNG